MGELKKLCQHIQKIEAIELVAEAMEVESKKLWSEALKLREELRRWEEDDD